MTTELKERNIYFFDKRRQLKIRNIAKDNEAKYWCEAKNILGVQKSKEVIVQVQCKYNGMPKSEILRISDV